MPAPKLTREALVDKILGRLKSQPDGRTLAKTDVHLTRVGGVRPNWEVQVDGADPAELESARRALSVYNLAAEGGTRRASMPREQRLARQVETDRLLKERLEREGQAIREGTAALKQARLAREAVDREAPA